MLEQLVDIYADGSKHEPSISVNIANINATIMNEENDEEKEIHLSLITKELIDEQNNDTFCSTKLK